MKNYFYSLIFILIINGNGPDLLGQNPSQKSKTYYTWVKIIGQSSEVKGYLLALQDSSILIQKKGKKGEEPLLIEKYPLHQITKISFRSKNADLNGFLIGGLIGFGLGGILGVNQGEADYGFFVISPRTRGTIWGTVLAMPGMLVGGLVGGEKKQFTLRGNQRLYTSYKPSWEKYVYYRDH